MKNGLFILFIFCMMVSCTENNLLEEYHLMELPEVLIDRPNKWVQANINIPDNETRSNSFQTLQIKDLIGYSFKNSIYPLEDTRNLGMRIIDPVFSKTYPVYFLAWKNLSVEARTFTYNSFDKFVDESTLSKTVNHGVDLKLLCFSIGHKHTFISTFGENMVTDSRSVFGEAHVYVRDSCFRMTYSPAINKVIIKSFLDSAFEQAVHSMHPYEFFKNYGGFVASDFSSGGQAIALYSALSQNTINEEKREGNLNKEMEASISWDNNLVNGYLKLGRDNESSISVTNTFSSIKMSLRTIGGLNSSSFSIPQEVNATSVDLSGWLSSMALKENNVIAEFNENGLIPISDFVIESNLKDLFNRYIAGEQPSNTNILEPCIHIVQVNTPNSPLTVTSARLITRYGDYFELTKFGTVLSWEGIKEFWKLIGELSSIFQIKIENHSALPNASMYSLSSPGYGVYENILSHKDGYTKLIYKGILFIIDEQDKVGFSIINNKEIIEEYGLTNFVSKLKKATISYQSIIDNGYIINRL